MLSAAEPSACPTAASTDSTPEMPVVPVDGVAVELAVCVVVLAADVTAAAAVVVSATVVVVGAGVPTVGDDAAAGVVSVGAGDEGVAAVVGLTAAATFTEVASTFVDVVVSACFAATAAAGLVAADCVAADDFPWEPAAGVLLEVASEAVSAAAEGRVGVVFASDDAVPLGVDAPWLVSSVFACSLCEDFEEEPVSDDVLSVEFLWVGAPPECVDDPADEEEEPESDDGLALATAAPPSSTAPIPTVATPVPSQVVTASVRCCERRCLPAISGSSQVVPQDHSTPANQLLLRHYRTASCLTDVEVPYS
ncbi:MAG: hypothetical protein P4L86_27695 [Mycobacterium sp.]|nr:hypothetical protein [Mycobacterium sp.]